MTSGSLCDVNLVDGQSLYDAGEYFAKLHSLDRASLDYTKLHTCLADIRKQKSLRQAQDSTLAISVDKRSSNQQRFISALERTPFDIDTVDFRDLFASNPPGVQPKESEERGVNTFAPRFAYVLGRLSRHEQAQIVIVSHAYELMWPMMDFKRANPNARIAIAYFKNLMDFRWQYSGLGTSDCPIEFFPLDEYVDELFGIDTKSGHVGLTQSHSRKEEKGLNKF